jgi:hypothetical protein
MNRKAKNTDWVGKIVEVKQNDGNWDTGWIVLNAQGGQATLQRGLDHIAVPISRIRLANAGITFHMGDIVQEKETGRQGKLNEAPRPEVKTDVLRWRVNFSDGKKPLIKYFTSESDLTLISCPHNGESEPGFVIERGIMN